jgi:hypothetical protein
MFLSVVEPHHVDADPDSTNHSDADPVPQHWFLGPFDEFWRSREPLIF